MKDEEIGNQVDITGHDAEVMNGTWYKHGGRRGLFKTLRYDRENIPKGDTFKTTDGKEYRVHTDGSFRRVK